MNKQLFRISHFVGFAAAFIGIFLSLRESNKFAAIETFVKVGMIPLTLMAFVWHTFAGGNIIQENCGFFEKEAGGANLGIAIALLVAISRSASIETLTSIILVYFVYMLIAMICQFAYIGIKKGMMTLPLVIVLGYFVSSGFTVEVASK